MDSNGELLRNMACIPALYCFVSSVDSVVKTNPKLNHRGRGEHRASKGRKPTKGKGLLPKESGSRVKI